MQTLHYRRMPKPSKSAASPDEARLFSVRLPPATIARLNDFAHVTKQSKQDVVRAALERHFREERLPADQARTLKALTRLSDSTTTK
jgi:predicted DNA-binding protein